MPRKKNQFGLKYKYNNIDAEAVYYIELVYKVRKSKNIQEINNAFKEILAWLDPKIRKIASRFRIPGNNFDDVYQECLVALQQKAIKDYDERHGKNPDSPAPFDRFALLCIRRHLSTKLKAANGNKTKTINESKSLDQDRSNDHSDLSLMDIVCSKDKDVAIGVQDREYFLLLMRKLVNKLSPFEMHVLHLYAKQFTYEEIAIEIKKRFKTKGIQHRVNIKSIDNALSRIKTKSSIIMRQINKKETR